MCEVDLASIQILGVISFRSSSWAKTQSSNGPSLLYAPELLSCPSVNKTYTEQQDRRHFILGAALKIQWRRGGRRSHWLLFIQSVKYWLLLLTRLLLAAQWPSNGVSLLRLGCNELKPCGSPKLFCRTGVIPSSKHCSKPNPSLTSHKKLHFWLLEKHKQDFFWPL